MNTFKEGDWCYVLYHINTFWYAGKVFKAKGPARLGVGKEFYLDSVDGGNIEASNCRLALTHEIPESNYLIFN